MLIRALSKGASICCKRENDTRSRCDHVTVEGTSTPFPPGFLGDTGRSWGNKTKRAAWSVEDQEGSSQPTTLPKTEQSTERRLMCHVCSRGICSPPACSGLIALMPWFHLPTQEEGWRERNSQVTEFKPGEMEFTHKWLISYFMPLNRMGLDIEMSWCFKKKKGMLHFIHLCFCGLRVYIHNNIFSLIN